MDETNGGNASGMSNFEAKIRRVLASILPVSSKRRGRCINCGACCKLPNVCVFLRYRSDGRSYCAIYALRPPSCRKYPRISSEFLTADTCGYSFRTDTPVNGTDSGIKEAGISLSER